MEATCEKEEISDFSSSFFFLTILQKIEKDTWSMRNWGGRISSEF